MLFITIVVLWLEGCFKIDLNTKINRMTAQLDAKYGRVDEKEKKLIIICKF